MLEQQSSYRQIMKATSIFGGVQVINIIITIIRSKFIAVLLGPAGMGIAGLLTTTTNLVGKLTDFGLSTSAVKDVSSANASGNQIRIATTITILRRLVWITGVAGTLIILAFSFQLSEITFGNKNYTLAFIIVSVTLLLNQISNGQKVILQGMRKVQLLAKANIAGSTTSLILTIPLYYKYSIDAIAPAIVIASAVSLFFSWFFSRKIKTTSIAITLSETFTQGKNMMIMGFMISLSGLLTLGGSYIVRLYISNIGGISEVGLYTAGFAIINSYVGMIFSAMSTDYYPRLSAVSHSNTLSKQTINQQAEVAVLLLSPILVIFIVFIQYVIIILYSNKFSAINDMINWAALGIFFKAASWSIGFIFMSKGSYKLLFGNELISNVYMILLNILGYYFYGLTGLGISFLLSYVLHLVQIFIFSKIYYTFSFDKKFYFIFSSQFTIAALCFLTTKYTQKPYSYIGGIFLIALSIFLSYIELNKRINIKDLIHVFFNKLRNDK